MIIEDKDANWILSQLEILPYKDVYKVIVFLQAKWREQNKEKEEENKKSF